MRKLISKLFGKNGHSSPVEGEAVVEEKDDSIDIETAARDKATEALEKMRTTTRKIEAFTDEEVTGEFVGV